MLASPAAGAPPSGIFSLPLGGGAAPVDGAEFARLAREKAEALAGKVSLAPVADHTSQDSAPAPPSAWKSAAGCTW